MTVSIVGRSADARDGMVDFFVCRGVCVSGFALLYGCLMGFTIAGLSACAFEYVTEKRLAFDIPPESGLVGGLAGFFIRLIAGPYMVARFIFELARAGEAPLLVAAGSVLVVSWSLSSGIVFISSFML